MNRLRTGVVGVGSFVSLHARAYFENSLTELVALADIEQVRTGEVARRYGAKFYTDYEEMYRSERLDIFSVATPDNLHVDPAVKAAETGIHVSVEKSIAMTLEDADRIIASAVRNDAKLVVNFILRFDPCYRVAYERVPSCGIGGGDHAG